jgi:hypothetical protein
VIRSLSLLLGVALAARAVAAQDPEMPPVAADTTAPPPVGVLLQMQLQLRLTGSYFDNFFRSPSALRPTYLAASGAEVRAAYVGLNPRTNIHARVAQTTFEGFAPSLAVAGGLEMSEGRHGIEATAGYQGRSPRLEFGDWTGFADVRHLTGAYTLVLPGAVQLRALTHSYDITRNTEPAGDQYTGFGGAVRFQGAGYRFMPEVGAARSRFDAAADGDRYDEQADWVSVRATPTPPFYLYVRYRRGVRTYVTATEAAANFEREDTRHHLTLMWELQLNRWLSWGFHYNYELAESTRAERRFDTQAVTSSFSARVW